MKFLRKSAGLLALLFLISPCWAATWMSIDYPGADVTLAFGINAGGDVVGYYGNTNSAEHGFLLRAGNYSTIDYPGSSDTVAYGVNASGVICGFYTDAAVNFHGFLFDGTSWTPLDFPGAIGTEATGINDAGDVVGIYWNEQQQGGFIWNSATGFSDLQLPGDNVVIYGINNRGFISGNFDGGATVFLRNPQGVVRNFNFGRDVRMSGGPNDHNTVVGNISRRIGSDAIRGNLTTKTSGTMRIPNSIWNVGDGINDAGQVVGFYIGAHNQIHGFIWMP